MDQSHETRPPDVAGHVYNQADPGAAIDNWRTESGKEFAVHCCGVPCQRRVWPNRLPTPIAHPQMPPFIPILFHLLICLLFAIATS